MNGFDGLLPSRVAAPPLPDRGGVATIRAGAQVRRRRSATRTAAAATAAALAAAILVLASPQGDLNGLSVEEPAHRPARPWPTATSPARPDLPAVPALAWPGLAPNAVASPAPPGPRPDSPADAGGAHSPSPSASPTADDPVLRPLYIEPKRSVVADRPGEPCRTQVNYEKPTHALCARYVGATKAKVGAPVDLVYEFCAQQVDVLVAFGGSQEISLTIAAPDAPAAMWRGNERNDPEGRHHTNIAKGTCLRYTTRWDGLDNAGRLPERGSYTVTGSLWDTGAHGSLGEEPRSLEIH